MLRIQWWILLVLVTVRSEPQPQNNESSKAYAVKDERRAWNPQLVDCYSCTDCEMVLYNTTVKTCPYHPDSSKMHKCVVYVEKYKYLGRPWYVRGCASELGTCAEIRKAHHNLQTSRDDSMVVLSSCLECEREKCNGASHSLPMFLSCVVSPIIAKLVIK